MHPVLFYGLLTMGGVMENEIGTGLKLLILDDDKDICHFTKEYFSRRGFEIFTATKGGAAIKLARKEKVDISLLDIHLNEPELSGLDVLKAIKKEVPGCYCIMVTRDDDRGKEADAMRLGAFDYLTKLITAKDLNKVILKAVKKLRKEGK